MNSEDLKLAAFKDDPCRSKMELSGSLSHSSTGNRTIDCANDTCINYPQDALIHEIFEDQVRRTPNNVALILGDQHLSYSQLNALANQLAHELLSFDLAPEATVGLFVERSLELVIGMLAILKAGSAYVPLDPRYPRDRLSFMESDSSTTAVITNKELVENLPYRNRPVIALPLSPSQPESQPRAPRLSSRQLAYVIYTSGSTGRPKGVMIEHRSVLRLVVNSTFARIGSDDCIAHCASPSFDATTWEIWAPLLNGATLLIVPREILMDPTALNQTLIHHKVTGLFLTTGLFHKYVDLVEPAFGNLKYLLVGGDTINPTIAARAVAKKSPPKHLLNAYGPTEATTFATTFDCDAHTDRGRPIPLGRPISNTRVYVLGEKLEYSSIGESGELCIGGPGVARGYINQPSLTAERFIPDTSGAFPSERIYRTGDLGRWSTDGYIEHKGRNDLQLKIRGFRIEPAEIEAEIQAVSGVSQAIVVALENEGREKRLMAYVVPHISHQEQPNKGASDDTGQWLAVQVRQHLCGRLPQYLIPAEIVVVEELPLTPNGKLDLRALRASAEVGPLRNFIPPRTTIEIALCRIWERLLGVNTVGITDNFFELGGDSMLGLTLISEVESELAIQLSFSDVFQYPTIERMALLADKFSPDNGVQRSQS